MQRLKLFIPLIIFAVLCVLLYRGLFIPNKENLPSALLDKPLPEFQLPAVNDPQRIVTRQDFLGQVALVNVWATWCPTCLAEHKYLVELAQQEQIPIYGVNYKDDPAKARKWLRELHDPYQLTVVDEQGRLGLDLGVYGAPETFVIDANGIIRYKHIGDVNPTVWKKFLEPVVNQLRQEAQQG